MDPAADMPLVNWAQTGSFRKPISPPLLGPSAGTLIQLPCINQDWLLILMGCIDQLRNTSTWNVSGSGLDLALSRVTELQEMLWSGMDVPCCNVSMRMTTACELQYSVDGGVTWSTVTDWDANFGPCVRSNLPPPPTNPLGTTQDQYACNLSGFLASEAIQGAVQIAYNQFNINATLIQFATELLPFLEAAGFIVTTAFADVALALYSYITNANKSDFNAAATDPVLKADLTCAIFSAIRTLGHVDSSNFPTILTNIAAISYTYPVVISAIHDYIAAMGESGFTSLQNVGALADEDCTGCGTTWCHEFNFVAGDAGWVVNPAAPYGIYLPGQGWGTTHIASVPGEYINIMSPTFPLVGHNTTQCCIKVTSTPYSTSSGHPRAFIVYNGGVQTGFEDFPSIGAYPSPTKVCAAATLFPPCNQMSFQWLVSNGGSAVVEAIQLIGTGVNPFGPNQCTF